MSKNQEVVDKLRTGYQTESIINDFGSTCTGKELGNIELYELGEISKTVQRPACLRYSQEK